jgi:hypothetical protein
MASHKEGCGFSSLMKQKIKAKNYAVFCFAGKRKLLYLHLRCDYMGEKKSSANYYWLLVKPLPESPF